MYWFQSQMVLHRCSLLVEHALVKVEERDYNRPWLCHNRYISSISSSFWLALESVSDHHHQDQIDDQWRTSTLDFMPTVTAYFSNDFFFHSWFLYLCGHHRKQFFHFIPGDTTPLDAHTTASIYAKPMLVCRHCITHLFIFINSTFRVTDLWFKFHILRSYDARLCLIRLNYTTIAEISS